MAQRAKTKRRTASRSKVGTKAKTKKATKTKKTRIARRNYEYDHQYGIKLGGRPVPARD
jgi:hypothetical protein